MSAVAVDIALYTTGNGTPLVYFKPRNGRARSFIEVRNRPRHGALWIAARGGAVEFATALLAHGFTLAIRSIEIVDTGDLPTPAAPGFTYDPRRKLGDQIGTQHKRGDV